MLLSKRRDFLLALAALPLAACGFSPIYKTGGAARGLKGRVRFNLIESREGYLLLQNLEARMGVPGVSPDYKAKIDLVIEEQVLTLTTATSLERVTVNGAAIITIVNTSTGAEVFADKLRETTGYTRSAETAETTSSRRDALDRLVGSLADQIVLRLGATAESWAA